MTTLNKFVASIQTQGLMTTNRFMVNFVLPAKLRSASVYTGNIETVMMQCDAINLPGMTISTQPSRTYGEVREMPYERLFDNINLSFYIDNTMNAKSLFDTWINSIQDPATRQFNYYQEYITDMTITVLDKADKGKYVIKLFECYPKAVSPIQMDYSSKDIMKLQVSMNYKYWTSSTATESDINGMVVDGTERLLSTGAQPGLGPFDDVPQFPNFNVDTSRIFPKF